MKSVFRITKTCNFPSRDFPPLVSARNFCLQISRKVARKEGGTLSTLIKRLVGRAVSKDRSYIFQREICITDVANKTARTKSTYTGEFTTICIMVTWGERSSQVEECSPPCIANQCLWTSSVHTVINPTRCHFIRSMCLSSTRDSTNFHS